MDNVMKPFSFHNPTRIVFGVDAIEKLTDIIANNSRVLVVTGGSSARKFGTLDQIASLLPNCQVEFFEGIEPNPELSTCAKVVEKIQAFQPDLLLAVGGGSVIDATKYIAVLAHFAQQKAHDYQVIVDLGLELLTDASLLQGLSNFNDCLPVYTVLTLPGTGSEYNRGCVISHSPLQLKLVFYADYPKVSILDPRKTLTLPARQVANGIVDSFVHVIEQFVTTKRNTPIQDGFALTLLKVLVDNGPKALATPEDLDVRSQIMWASSLALNGLISAGVDSDWATHMIGHELTALYHIDHARTLSTILLGVWASMDDVKQDKLALYAQEVFKAQGTKEELVKAAFTHTLAWFKAMGVPTNFVEAGLNDQALNEIMTKLKHMGYSHLGELDLMDQARMKQALVYSLDDKSNPYLP